MSGQVHKLSSNYVGMDCFIRVCAPANREVRTRYSGVIKDMLDYITHNVKLLQNVI